MKIFTFENISEYKLLHGHKVRVYRLQRKTKGCAHFSSHVQSKKGAISNVSDLIIMRKLKHHCT